MFGRIASRLAIGLLKRSDLSIEDRNLLTASIMEKLGAFPLSDVINITSDNRLIVSGREVDADTFVRLRQSARAAQSNGSLRLIRDQVLFEAITFGVHRLEKTDQSFFSRAAIWWHQRVDKMLSELADYKTGPGDDE